MLFITQTFCENSYAHDVKVKHFLFSLFLSLLLTFEGSIKMLIRLVRYARNFFMFNHSHIIQKILNVYVC